MAKRLTESEVLSKHSGVQEGTMTYITPEVIEEQPDLTKWANKQVVQRICAGCDDRFVVATSDLHQKCHCDGCTKERRKVRAKVRRAEDGLKPVGRDRSLNERDLVKAGFDRGDFLVRGRILRRHGRGAGYGQRGHRYNQCKKPVPSFIHHALTLAVPFWRLIRLVPLGRARRRRMRRMCTRTAKSTASWS